MLRMWMIALIECVGAIDRVSLPIYNNYPKEHSQRDKVELDED